MSTTRFEGSRGVGHGETVVFVGSAIAGDMRFAAEDALTRDEILIELEKLRNFILETDWPPN